MIYKFKPQTGILVAGLLIATYADACYYQATSAVCFNSGDTVDVICWPDGLVGGSKVTATSQWSYSAAPNNLIYTGTGTVGNSTASLAGSGAPLSYCTGPAQFKDYAGHTTSVTTWENNTVNSGSSACGVSLNQIKTIYPLGGTLTGGTCM